MPPQQQQSGLPFSNTLILAFTVAMFAIVYIKTLMPAEQGSHAIDYVQSIGTVLARYAGAPLPPPPAKMQML
jgi:hypothetical protein